MSDSCFEPHIEGVGQHGVDIHLRHEGRGEHGADPHERDQQTMRLQWRQYFTKLRSVRSTHGLCVGANGQLERPPQFQGCCPGLQLILLHRYKFQQPTTIFLAEMDRAWTTTPYTYVRKVRGQHGTDPHERGHPAAPDKEKTARAKRWQHQRPWLGRILAQSPTKASDMITPGLVPGTWRLLWASHLELRRRTRSHVRGKRCGISWSHGE